MITIYNQLLEKFTRSWCTIYTLFGIVSDQWGLILYNKEIIKTLRKAEQDKVWWESWGAYFSSIYRWFVWYIFIMHNLKLRVKRVDILSDEFEEMVNKGYSFWLGLKKANSTYVKLAADWELTQADITALFKSWKGAWHNHRYFKGYIIESLNLVDNTIKLSLWALREGVRLWLYYNTARTLSEANVTTAKVGQYLKILTFHPNVNIKPENKFEEDCLNKAWDLFLLYKAGRKNT